MFACKMERIPLPCAFYSEFRIPNSAFAPLQNASTYGKIERADESQRNIGSDDRETVARASPLPISNRISESRRVVRGGRAHGVNLHPASFSRFREAGQPYRPSSGGNRIFPCRKTSGTADSVRLISNGGTGFFHPTVRRNIRNEREDRSPEKQL